MEHLLWFSMSHPAYNHATSYTWDAEPRWGAEASVIRDLAGNLFSQAGAGVVDSVVTDPMFQKVLADLQAGCKDRAKQGALDALKESAPWLAGGVAITVFVNALTVRGIVKRALRQRPDERHLQRAQQRTR